jgi:hypothetical protein
MVVSSWNRTVMSAQHGQRGGKACLGICSSIGWLQSRGGYKRARPRTVLFDEGVRVATEHGSHRRPVHSDVEEDGARGHSQSSWWACHKVLLGHLQANGVGDVGVNLRHRARNSQSPRGWGHGRTSPSPCHSCTSTSTSTIVRGLMEAARPHTCDLHRSICCTHDGWSRDDSAVARKRTTTTGDTYCLASYAFRTVDGLQTTTRTGTHPLHSSAKSRCHTPPGTAREEARKQTHSSEEIRFPREHATATSYLPSRIVPFHEVQQLCTAHDRNTAMCFEKSRHTGGVSSTNFQYLRTHPPLDLVKVLTPRALGGSWE